MIGFILLEVPRGVNRSHGLCTRSADVDASPFPLYFLVCSLCVEFLLPLPIVVCQQFELRRRLRLSFKSIVFSKLSIGSSVSGSGDGFRRRRHSMAARLQVMWDV